ncbi:MAG: type II toxin-antitoxin system VapB family antitoxin [Acidimicrobiia bacterium]
MGIRYTGGARERYSRMMTKRLVDIDDDLLQAATEVLGARTMREAVNLALGEVVAARRRERLIERFRTGDGTDLADPHVMDQAWK